MVKRAAVHLPYGPHWKGAGDVPEIANARGDVVRRVAGGLVSTIKARSILRVIGPSGAGKSFTIARAAERCLERTQEPFEIVWLEFSSWSQGWGLLRELHDQIIGDGLSRRLNARELRADLRHALAERPRLLVLDEAQWARTVALIILAKLNDYPETNFALVIAGTADLLGRYPDELQSRTFLSVDIEPLAKTEVAAVLRDYHPIFSTADAKKLALVNQRDARGSFRWWAQLLTAWWHAHDHYGTELSDDILDELAELIRVATKNAA